MSRKSLVVRPLAAAGILTSALVVSGVPFDRDAHAETAIASAWWTSAQIDGLPVGAATFVPDGGLQVAAGSQGAVSIAALRFEAPAGRTVEVTLRLTDGSTAETASIVACPITEDWTPARAGSFEDAPAWDCDLGQTAARVDQTERTVVLELPASFARAGAIDLMLLPVQDSLPFNATAHAPAAADLATRPGGDTPAPTAGAGASQAAAEETTATTAFSMPFGTAGPALPPVDVTSALPAALPAAPEEAASDVRAARTAPAPTGSDAGRALGVAMLLGALVTAVALRLGVPVPGRVHDPEPARGIGRFRQPRPEAPQPI